MKRAAAIFAFAIFFAALSLPVLAAGRTSVTASVLPIWVFAKHVAGERADVSLLVPPGTDVHEYSLSPRDVKALHDADLLMISGLGLEPFTDRLPRDVKVAEAASGYATSPDDPHVWLDPLLAQGQVNAIARALADIDPQGKAQYEANARGYIRRLEDLHESISRQLAPLKGMPLITYHESFTHFAARYGLKAYSLTGPHAEQPLPQRMKQVYDIVRQKAVRAVFAEEQYPPDLMQRLSSDLGVEVCPLGTVTTGEPFPGLYEQVMRENVQTILRCLGEGS